MSAQRFSIPKTVVEVVFVSPVEPESLLRFLGHSHTSVRWFPTCHAALAFLHTHSAGVVISNVELPDGSWKDLLDALSCFKPPPNLIVSSLVADERLWAEVLNLGGYDVLVTPFEPDEVLRVTAGAWLAWQGELEKSSPPHNTETDPSPAERAAACGA
ncbi:MAG: hypothetical protein HY820_29755 [Acidobacteria bacterium]|nr:hypothetical protein [Acidobacteriota bacterium]